MKNPRGTWFHQRYFFPRNWLPFSINRSMLWDRMKRSSKRRWEWGPILRPFNFETLINEASNSRHHREGNTQGKEDANQNHVYECFTWVRAMTKPKSLKATVRVGLGLGPIWYMDFTTQGRRRGKMDKISSPSESLERKKKWVGKTSCTKMVLSKTHNLPEVPFQQCSASKKKNKTHRKYESYFCGRKRNSLPTIGRQ